MARAAKFFPRVAQEVRQIISTIAMVAAGAGVAVVPASARCIHIGRVALVLISDAGAQSWLHMILPFAPPYRMLAELMGLLRTAVQAEAA